MNLLFDCHTFDAGPQGTTTFLAGLLNALPGAARARRRKLELTCAAGDPANVARFTAAPCRFVAMPGGFLARNLLGLPRLTRDPAVGAVVSQYVRPFRSGVPTVSVIHDVLCLDFPALFGWRHRMIRKLLFGWAARHSDVVMTVSDYSRGRIAHHFGIDPARIDVVPNAVAVTGPLPAAERNPGPLRLLYVSRFETRKRQEWCVSTANALATNGREVELTLVGHAEGAYADHVRAEIAATQVPGAAVTIRSDVSADELARLYSETDLFLFPSGGEGFGIPVIEAAAHGVPCVVAANTAMIELAGHYAGVPVTGEDCADFIAAVTDAVDRLATLRAAALVQAPLTRAAWRWPEVARAFLAILEQRGVGGCPPPQPK